LIPRAARIDHKFDFIGGENSRASPNPSRDLHWVVPVPSKTPSLAVLAAILVLGGCEGRSSGLLGAGSGTNESGGSSGNVTATPEGSTGESQPDGSMADSPTVTDSEGSSGNPIVIVDARANATGAGNGAVDATMALEGSALIDAPDAGPSEADIAVPCGPPATGMLFVDPNAGHDDDGGTGSQGCPFKSLTHALSLVGDAGVPMTVEIVNTSAAPTLSQSTGEVFPITVPGGVTITAEDATKNTPTVEVDGTSNPPCGSARTCGFFLSNPNARLSHFTVNYQGMTGTNGIMIASPGTVTIDHVTIQNFRGTENEGIFVQIPNGASGIPTIGPGVVVRGSAGSGLHVFLGANVTITGGQGADHTSFSQNSWGITVEARASVNITGTAIDPSDPGTSDVDVDNNIQNGLLLNASGTGVVTNTVHGLHAAGNGSTGILCGLPLKLRGSYVGENGAVTNNPGGIVVGAATCDLGNPVGPDYGRNTLVGNTGWAVCNDSGQTIPAAGNIFGSIDCAVGGKLDPSVTCGDTTSVNVSNCTF
jgi:hypothetical protein